MQQGFSPWRTRESLRSSSKELWKLSVKKCIFINFCVQFQGIFRPCEEAEIQAFEAKKEVWPRGLSYKKTGIGKFKKILKTWDEVGESRVKRKQAGVNKEASK